MKNKELAEPLLQRACLGNAEALDFLRGWLIYCHAVDDVVDEQLTTDGKISAFIACLDVFTRPFFLRHGAALKPAVFNIANLYADSVAWEKSSVPWKKDFAEFARHAGAEMVLNVAAIVGGFAHMRSISAEVRELCWSPDDDAWAPTTPKKKGQLCHTEPEKA